MKRGFTLIEMATTLTVMSIVAALAVPQVHGAILRAKSQEAYEVMAAIARAEKDSHTAFLSPLPHPPLPGDQGIVAGKFGIDNTAYPWSQWNQKHPISAAALTSSSTLGIRMPGSLYCDYTVINGGGGAFAISAICDMDGDGTQAHYMYVSPVMTSTTMSKPVGIEDPTGQCVGADASSYIWDQPCRMTADGVY